MKVLATVTTENIQESYELLVILRNVKFDDSGCWLWTGWLDKDGYAYSQIPNTRKKARTHRQVYQRLVGAIPDEMVLHHTCRVRNCVNPDHLVIMTNEENVRLGWSWQASKTHCKHGHKFTPENTYRSKIGGRICKMCALHRNRRKIAV